MTSQVLKIIGMCGKRCDINICVKQFSPRCFRVVVARNVGGGMEEVIKCMDKIRTFKAADAAADRLSCEYANA